MAALVRPKKKKLKKHKKTFERERCGL